MAIQNEKIMFLKEQIGERLKKTDSSRVYYRRQSFRFYMLTAILTGITTIILGLNLHDADYAEIVRVTAIIITTFVTILNVYNAFFNHKELWVAYNNATNRFHQLKFEIEFAETGGTAIDEAGAEAFRKNYQDIIDELNATWQQNRLLKTSAGK